MTRTLQSDRANFSRDLLRYLPSAVVPSLVGMLILPVLTGVFNPHAYGNYALALVIYGFLDAIASAWYSSTIIRFYAGSREGETPDLDGTMFNLGILWSLGASGLFIIATILARPFIERELFELLLFIPVLMVASNMLELPLNILRSYRRIGAYNWLTIAKTVLTPTVGVAIGVLLGGKVIGLMIGTAAVTWLLLPISFRLCFRGRKLPNARLFPEGLVSELLSFGLPLIPSVLMVTVLSISDRLIIGAFRGSVEVGIYSIAYSLASLPLVLVYGILTRAAAPVLVSTWEQKGRAAAESLQTFATRMYMLVGVPAVIGLSLLADDIMELLAARPYREGSTIFWFVSAGTLLIGLQWIGQRGMILSKDTKRIFLYYVIAGVANILANVALVPIYGYVAASWTTLATYILLLVLIAAGSERYLSWKLPYATFARIGVGCLLMGAAIRLLPHPLLGSVILDLLLKMMIGVGIYGVVVLGLGEFPLRRLRVSRLPVPVRQLEDRAP